MGVFDKFMKSMRLNDDYEDEYDDDYMEEDTPRRGLFGGHAEDDEYEDSESKPGIFNRNIKPAPARRGLEVSMIKPTAVEDARTVANFLLSGKAVVLNMEGINMELAQRIIDFTSGSAYSINGKLQKISNYIFIATPANVDLSGEFQDLLNAANFDVSQGGALRF